jgi:hypothetical protein
MTNEYSFSELEIKYKDEYYSVSGSATYEIENDGIGAYEYWGSKEYDAGTNYAVFEDAHIDDIVFLRADELPKNNLMEQDMNNIVEIILDTLNEDHELCFELGEKPYEPDFEEDAE